MTISLQFHGATEGVTGSCHQISLKDESVLIDCGIFQGKEARGHNDLKIDFDISNIKGLVHYTRTYRPHRPPSISACRRIYWPNLYIYTNSMFGSGTT